MLYVPRDLGIGRWLMFLVVVPQLLVVIVSIPHLPAPHMSFLVVVVSPLLLSVFLLIVMLLLSSLLFYLPPHVISLWVQ